MTSTNPAADPASSTGFHGSGLPAAPPSALASLEPDELEALAGIGRFVDHQDRSDIVVQGKRHDRLFVLVSGGAKVTRNAGGGAGRLALADLHSGDFFGEIGILDSQPASANVSADGHCTAWEIDRSAFDRFLHDYPAAGHRLLIGIARVLGKRLRTANARIQSGPGGHVLDGWW